MSWRARFAPHIQRVLSAYPRPCTARDDAFRRAYPLAPPWRDGPSYPYRVWRDEIARQTGRKPRIPTPSAHPRCPYTLDLFDPSRCPLTLDLFA